MSLKITYVVAILDVFCCDLLRRKFEYHFTVKQYFLDNQIKFLERKQKSVGENDERKEDEQWN